MAEAIEEKKIAYLKSSNFLRRWSERRCEVCEVDGIELSMARAAPPLLHARPVEAVPKRAANEVPSPKKKVSEDKYLNVFNAALKVANAASDFSDWLNRPPALLLPAAAAAAAKSPAARALRKVPAFDIQDVPKAMRKLHMPMAAKLQERWFAGQENYSTSSAGLMNEVDQKGLRYAPSMIESTAIKMDWVLSFPRAKAVFDKLVSDDLQSRGAIDTLRRQLTPYKNRREVLGWNVAQSDFLEFHKKFQFQRAAVNGTWG